MSPNHLPQLITFKSKAEREHDGALEALRQPARNHIPDSAKQGAKVGAILGAASAGWRLGGGAKTLGGLAVKAGAHAGAGAAVGTAIGGYAGHRHNKQASAERVEAVQTIARTRPILAREAADFHARGGAKAVMREHRANPVTRPVRKPEEKKSVLTPGRIAAGVVGGGALGLGVMAVRNVGRGMHAIGHVGPRKPKKFGALTPGMVFFSRPRTPAGTFAGGETAGSPEDMTRAYGPVASRPAALLGAAGAGGLVAAAGRMLKKVKKK